MPGSELADVIRSGDLDAIRSLLDAGADIRYVRPRGYTATIDAMFSDATSDDDRLIAILQFLIERGADVNAASDYGESALSVAANRGKLDVVHALLIAGADRTPLEWTMLMLVVVFGNVEHVRERLDQGDDLTARDRWDRTAWLLSLQTGDVAKAKLLLAAGADRTDRGRCGKTALIYPIRNGHSSMVQWLLSLGFDPNEECEGGWTALFEAASEGDSDCVKMLLDAGADVHHRTVSMSAIGSASTIAVVRLLVDAGAVLDDLNAEMRIAMTGLARDGELACSLDDYQFAKHRVFGTSNPERMNFPFWKAMVAAGVGAHCARSHFEPEPNYREAVWCFDRFGKSITELPDGRIIEIGGEYEAYYDADFCIYNDVIVHRGDGTFNIYGYPEDVFPPTDFHTATLVDDSIYIIGSVGYQGRRQFGSTPVYRLDIRTLAIEPVATFGESPGWISNHRARLVEAGIEVSGGKVGAFVGDEERYEDNANTHILDPETGRWSRP